MDTIKDKKRQTISLLRKLPVWSVVWSENFPYEGDAFCCRGRLTLRDARLLYKKMCKSWHNKDVAVVLDIRDEL